MAFTALPVDLSRAGAQPIVPPGVELYAITVFSIPNGLLLTARKGSGDLFPLYFATQTVEFCPPITDGLQLIIPAGLTGTVTIGVNAKQAGTPPATSAQAPATFLGGATWASAGNGAGQVSVVQLQNPAASQKLLSVRAVGGAQSVAALGSIYLINTIRAGAPASSFTTPTSPAMPAAVALFKGANAIATTVTPAGFDQHIGGSGGRATLNALPQPLIVRPGWAVELAGSFGSNGVNMLLCVAWDEY